MWGKFGIDVIRLYCEVRLVGIICARVRVVVARALMKAIHIDGENTTVTSHFSDDFIGKVKNQQAGFLSRRRSRCPAPATT